MPLIFKSKSERLAAQLAARSAFRSTTNLVDQLQEQLRSERAQHRYNMAEKERKLAIVLRELAEARLELARRDGSEAFARAPSPSTMMH